ncbi:universal stress protein [Bradyrhizobium manausense]|uniref:universal stress protein n=1 Tax=Bradyrhizobium TaxID=374 RepID=UPI001BA90273|nr:MULTISPECIES: universal stress protein [Bradyrhizobium]MBR0826240.1 universal stress protein [Bradyrhizobium manausense]UVO31748.1 universal stress protein [Bradyrhizobium arachidis]
MPIKDVLLPLVGEPSEPNSAAIEKCVAAAADWGAKITGLAVAEDIWVRPKVVISADVENAEEAQARRSVTNVSALLETFKESASRMSVRAETRLHKFAPELIAQSVAEYARFGDLTLLPVKSHDSRSEKIVEALLFESGRPLLLCPEERAARLRPELENVIIAWDHSARAARAVGDAMPILQEANSVRVVTVADEKTEAIMHSGTSLVDHLREHGVYASFETTPVKGSSIGKVLGIWAHAHSIDAIVMGAYHHSRMNEIVWGGVTKTVMGAPPCWVMMSH